MSGMRFELNGCEKLGRLRGPSAGQANSPVTIMSAAAPVHLGDCRRAHHIIEDL